MFESAFAEVAALLLAAALIGALALWLRQPLIIAFIIVGILAGCTIGSPRQRESSHSRKVLSPTTTCRKRSAVFIGGTFTSRISQALMG